MLAMEQTGHAISNAATLLRQMATKAHINNVRRAVASWGARDPPARGACALAARARLCDQPAVQAYLEVIEALPAKSKEACSLLVRDGLTHAEIATCLGISDKMLKPYMQRGKIVCAQRHRLMDEPVRLALHLPKQ